MPVPTLRPLRFLTVALFFALIAAPGCSEDAGEDDHNDNTNNDLNDVIDDTGDTDADYDPEPEVCELTSWQCDEFVDGPSLTEVRHGHQTMVLDDGKVLLLDGSRRYEDGSSTRSHTWEILDTKTDQVVADGEFEETRRSPSLKKLDNGGILAIGGIDSRGDQKSSVLYLEPDTLEWSDAPSMNAGYRMSTTLEDGRILVGGVSQPPGSDSADLYAQIFDPGQWSWSSLDAAELPHTRVWDVRIGALSNDKALLYYRHLAPEEVQPDEDIDVFEASAAIYDFEAGTTELLETFEPINVQIIPKMTWLPHTEQYILHLRQLDLQEEGPTLAFLFDPQTEQLEPHFEREPSPGEVLTVLPGDELIYRSSTQVQLYDVSEERWRNFGHLPDHIYYSSMDILPDCRLFASGERTLNAPNENLRGVDTGYCLPEGYGEEEEEENNNNDDD